MKPPVAILLGLAAIGLAGCATTDTADDFEIILPDSQEAVANRMFFNGKADAKGNITGRSEFEGQKFQGSKSAGWGGKFEKKQYHTNAFQDIRKEGVFSGKKVDLQTANETRQKNRWTQKGADNFSGNFAGSTARESSSKVERQGYWTPKPKSSGEQKSSFAYVPERPKKIIRSRDSEKHMSIEDVAKLFKGQ